MKKIKKISVVLALLAFTLLYSASLAFADTTPPPGIPSPFGGSNDDDDDGPPVLHGPDQPSGNETQPDQPVDSNQNGGGGGGGGGGSSSSSNGATSGRNNTSSQTASLNGTDNTVADAQDSQDAQDTAGSGADEGENEPDNLTETGPELIYLILPTLGLSASYFFYKNKR